MTLADEIARAAIGLARWQRLRPPWIFWLSPTVSEWSLDRSRSQLLHLAVGYARGLLDSRTPPRNIDATGGRKAGEGGLGLTAPNDIGLTMPPLW